MWLDVVLKGPTIGNKKNLNVKKVFLVKNMLYPTTLTQTAKSAEFKNPSKKTRHTFFDRSTIGESENKVFYATFCNLQSSHDMAKFYPKMCRQKTEKY